MMWCAVLVALAVLIWPGNKSGRLYRLAYRGAGVGGDPAVRWLTAGVRSIPQP